MNNYQFFRSPFAWSIKVCAALFIILSCGIFHAYVATAQTQLNEPSSRAQAICPELSKLAEAIALAHSIDQSRNDTIRIIIQSMAANPDEITLIENLVNAIYDKPELTSYEHTQRTQVYCFEEFRRITNTTDHAQLPAL